MNTLRLLVLLGLLLATQGRVLDQDKTPEIASSPEETKNAEVKQETQPELPTQQSSEAIKPVELKQELTNEAQPQVDTQVVQEKKPELVNSIDAKVDTSEVIKPEVTKVNQEPQVQEVQPTSNEITKDQELPKKEEEPKVQEVQPTSNEITKDQELPKEEVIPQKHNNKQARDNKIQLVFEQPGQTQNQYPQLTIQDLEKIFKYPGVQVINGTQSSSNQYQNHFNKFQGSYPKVEYVSVVNTSANANVTEHVHNHTHYYVNQKKPGFPFPFLPNPFEKLEQQQQPIYVSVNQTSNSTTGNVTYHTHIHEETKPFPFLPNPFTDFPKVVGLSLVLLPNPFYKNQNQNTGSQENVTYEYFGKFRGFSEETQKDQQKQQQQQQSQKPNFYLIPNPLANQVNADGQKGDVLFPVNLASLPLLVPAPEFQQGKASASGSISFQDLIKATNVHVSQPIKLQANNGLSQLQKEQAAIQQLILSHLSEQQKLFEKQSLGSGKSVPSAEPVGVVPEEEESSVLFAVEIPKPIYRFFKGIFGGFSK
ncbi:probable basic-leucine zipper transcription factor R [Drosophila takahashii]|uniref:probable basic-leucine zipper transcription factor R n=1 Tax=Drosophila takahashii TaxID=29030 RepID=UPI001CF857BC|nr:alpha-protein kinase 1 [Drosophila takahashii]